MNTIVRRGCILVCAITLIGSQAQALNIVGYVNEIFTSGNTLFSNPLQAPTNNLSSLFGVITPNGSTVSLWNSTTMSYDTVSTYFGGSWSLDLTLNPGTGALFSSPSIFTNTFVGEVLNHDGTLAGDGDNLLPPPLYAGPNGLFLLADKAPVSSVGTNIFLNILGRAPNVGEQVITLTGTSTYLGGGVWDNDPTLGVGEAAFLNVGPVPVPEPTVVSLCVVGGAALVFFRRRRQ
jgi:hypothetical protein